jgi:hypothetical protein
MLTAGRVWVALGASTVASRTRAVRFTELRTSFRLEDTGICMDSHGRSSHILDATGCAVHASTARQVWKGAPTIK